MIDRLYELNARELESWLKAVFKKLEISKADQITLRAFLAPLKYKNSTTYNHYLHSLRVGLLSWLIGKFVHLDENSVFYPGLMHDAGKCQILEATLGKTDSWTAEDVRRMKQHAVLGYQICRDRFDFSAEVILWVHRFQQAGYPLHVPKLLHDYSQGTKLLIAECGRMVAIADVYDALHRENSKFGAKRKLSGDEIKDMMLRFNLDRTTLIEDLYKAKIFVT